MRHAAGALAVALAVSGALLVAGIRGAECRAVADEAGLLTPSSRLEGAAEMLRRDGVDTLIHTTRGQAVAHDTATRLAATCRELERPDADAVLVVVDGGDDVAVLGVGSIPADKAVGARAAIVSSLRGGSADVSTAVAHGLEQLWQVRADDLVSGEERRDAGNPWARRHRSRVIPGAFGGGVASFIVVLLLSAARRRRRQTRRARVQAQRSRSALAQHYVDLDAAVVAAVAQQRSAGHEVPADLTAAVVAADQRACAALFDTAGSPPRRRGAALAAAALCEEAEQDLRAAVLAISMSDDLAAARDNVTAATFPCP